MTSKEKAEELVLRYYSLIPMNTISFAKQCAIIAVDEISKHCYKVMESFWEEVKQEIKELN
jgi:hypothetical protein